jgi:hypothetical protein
MIPPKITKDLSVVYAQIGYWNHNLDTLQSSLTHDIITRAECQEGTEMFEFYDKRVINGRGAIELVGGILSQLFLLRS